MKRFITTLGLAVVAAAAIGCSSAAGGGQPSASAGPVAPGGPTIVAQNNVFSPASLTVEADKAFSLTLDNKDAAPHNVAIFRDASAAESVSIGEIVSSTTATQQVPALAAGEYFFRCDIHKEMTGTIVAE
jgi:plastocyanin